MKKVRQLNFRMKIMLYITGILTGFFLVVIIVVQFVSNLYTRNYVSNNVYIQQERCDAALDTLFVDTNANLLKLFTTENIEILIESTNKDETLKTLYSEKSFSTNIYGGIACYSDGRLLAETDNRPLVDNLYQDKLLESDQYLTYAKTVESSGENFLVLGKIVSTDMLVFVYLREQVVLDLLNNILSNGYSFLVANDSYVISYPDVAISGSYIFDKETFNISKGQNYSVGTVDGEKSLIAIGETTLVRNSFDFDWKIISVVPYADLFATLDLFRLLLIIATIVMLVISVVLAIKVSSQVVKPLKTLSNKVETFNPTLDKKYVMKSIDGSKKTSKDEIYRLEESYDSMIARIYDLMEKNIQDMDEKRRLELDSLQQQINPHFLYNTLDAIAWMAKIKKEPEIETLVMSLAKFFRISLHRGDKIITIGEEIELTQHYLEIEQIRFPDRFSITYDVDPLIINYKTLKLILQPIVENAIKYGMQNGNGSISIKVYKDEDEIVYEIKDDGQGFEVPNDMFAKPLDTFSNSKSGYGLFNVNERIRLEYGEYYGLNIKSVVGKGTIVTIRIPIRE